MPLYFKEDWAAHCIFVMLFITHGLLWWYVLAHNLTWTEDVGAFLSHSRSEAFWMNLVFTIVCSVCVLWCASGCFLFKTWNNSVSAYASENLSLIVYVACIHTCWQGTSRILELHECGSGGIATKEHTLMISLRLHDAMLNRVLWCYIQWSVPRSLTHRNLECVENTCDSRTTA